MNKFKKAVEQRNEEEKEEGKLLEVDASKNEEDKLPVGNTKEEAKQNEYEEPEKVISSKFDLTEIIKVEERKKGASKVLYLDKDVIDKIHQIAKKQKTSDSKVVNDILKHVLFQN